MKNLLKLLLASLLVFALSACGEDRSERAITSEGDTSSSEEESQEDAPADGAGEKLSEEQLQNALLTVQDMPTGWTSEKVEPDSEDEGTVSPKRCQAVLDGITEEAVGEPAAKAEASFSQGGAFGTQLDETLSSFEDEVESDAFQAVADAFTQCPEITIESTDGSKQDFTISPLSFPNLGDHTVAFNLVGESEGFEFQLNLVSIAVGHNTVAFTAVGIAGVDPKEIEKIARKAVKKLEETAG